MKTNKLLAAPQVEPVAWMWLLNGKLWDLCSQKDRFTPMHEGHIQLPLYAAPPAPPAIVPGDMVMVPREPTTHAVSRGVVALYESSRKDFSPSGSEVVAVYRAMIAAAPAQPAPTDDEILAVIPAGEAPYRTICGRHELLDFARRVLALAQPAVLADHEIPFGPKCCNKTVVTRCQGCPHEQPAVREPLTEEQIDKIFDAAHENMPKGVLFRTFVARAVEAHHGITGGGNG